MDRWMDRKIEIVSERCYLGYRLGYGQGTASYRQFTQVRLFCLFMLGARHDVCAAFTFLGACTGLCPHMIQTL